MSLSHSSRSPIHCSTLAVPTTSTTPTKANSLPMFRCCSEGHIPACSALARAWMPMLPASLSAQQNTSTAATADEQSTGSQQRVDINVWSEREVISRLSAVCRLRVLRGGSRIINGAEPNIYTIRRNSIILSVHADYILTINIVRKSRNRHINIMIGLLLMSVASATGGYTLYIKCVLDTERH